MTTRQRHEVFIQAISFTKWLNGLGVVDESKAHLRKATATELRLSLILLYYFKVITVRLKRDAHFIIFRAFYRLR